MNRRIGDKVAGGRVVAILDAEQAEGYTWPTRANRWKCPGYIVQIPRPDGGTTETFIPAFLATPTPRVGVL